jgi:hypothetical protein
MSSLCLMVYLIHHGLRFVKPAVAELCLLAQQSSRIYASCLPMTSYKKGSHPELVSGPHRTGFPHKVHLASGVPKQVRHDSGVKGDCQRHLQNFAKFYRSALT